jgi:hypothetical protein
MARAPRTPDPLRRALRRAGRAAAGAAAAALCVGVKAGTQARFAPSSALATRKCCPTSGAQPQAQGTTSGLSSIF